MKAIIGRYAFLAGLLISVVMGFVNLGANALAALVVLGILVGFLNVTGKESQRFLLGTIALMVVGSVGIQIPAVGSVVTNILQAFVMFVAGAALVVSLKEVYGVTKDK